MKCYLIKWLVFLALINPISFKEGIASSDSFSSSSSPKEIIDGERRTLTAASSSSSSSSTSSSSSSSSRQDEDDEDDSEILPKHQIYANPIFDATAKYALGDDTARLGFIKILAEEPTVRSTELLDNSLNPLRVLTEARNFLSNDTNGKIIKHLRKVKDQDHIKIEVFKKETGKKLKKKPKKDIGEEQQEATWQGIKNGGAFLSQMSRIFGDLQQTFPPLERHSQLDVVCKLSTGGYALVEVQVKPQDFWDERSLSYAAAFYGNQLKRGAEWGELKKVIAINLLGGSTNHWRETESQELKRHYKFVSNIEGSQHEIGALQLIQYNLNSPKIDALPDSPLKEWLQFWRSGHMKTTDETKTLSDEAVKAAYKKILIAELPREIRKRYIHEVKDFQKFSQHIQHAIEEAQEKARTEERTKSLKEGRQEGMRATALKMLQKKMSDADILELTELTQPQLDQLKKDTAEKQEK